MIETENKVYARRCESHVGARCAAPFRAASRRSSGGARPLTITVKQDKLPEAVHYLYYERYGWIPVIVGNDERSLCGRYAVYYVISMEGGSRLGDRAHRGRSRQDDVPVRDAVCPRLRVGRARASRHVWPDSRGTAIVVAWCCPMTGPAACTRCARTPWTTASVPLPRAT